MPNTDTDPGWRESVAKEAGNGAHVYVPSEWEGDIVRVTRVAGTLPPLFEGLEEDDHVSIEYVSKETDESQTIEGTVDSIESSLNNDTFYSRLQLEWAEDEAATEDHARDEVVVRRSYEVSVARDPGEDGWEGPYKLHKKTMAEQPFGDDDIDISEVVGSGETTWLGNVTSLAVKHTVDP